VSNLTKLVKNWKKVLAIVLVMVIISFAAITLTHVTDVFAGYGRCSECSCPGFQGSGYTCTRGGCGHHYDQHW